MNTSDIMTNSQSKPLHADDDGEVTLCTECGTEMDPDDLETETAAYNDGEAYRPQDETEHYCKYCRCRCWDVSEPFSKWGFDDGDGRVVTGFVAQRIEDLGYKVSYDKPGCHNEFIITIHRGDEVIYDADEAWAKHGDEERMFAALPADIRAAVAQALYDDILDMGRVFVIPQSDIDLLKSSLDNANEAAKESAAK
jgi:hypothetical protein